MTRLTGNSKYRNVRCEMGGMKFASKAERSRYIELDLMKGAGIIRWFNVQPSFVVGPGIRYLPDFIVCDSKGKIFVEDVKSPSTEKNSTFVMKAKLFRAAYPDIELRIIK